MSLLIDLQQITKSYQAASHDFHVLKGIDLRLYRGELLAIVGSSGSGKSTLMNIMGFLDRGTTGAYFFDQQDVSSLSDNQLADIRNQKIGFVFQSFFLLPRLTALQNVMLPLFYREEPTEIQKKKSLNMLEKVGMLSFAARKPNQLSGGQQQRIAIARALVGQPDVIFADEPTGALDSKTGQDVMELLLRLNREEHKTIVIVTHDKKVSQLCHRTIELKDGFVHKNAKPQ